MTIVESLEPEQLEPQGDEPASTEDGAAKGRSGWIVVANVIFALVVVVVALGVAGSALGFWRVEVVLSGSMRPGIQPGDLEILQHESTSALHVGQIVAFHPPHWTATVTHRVVALQHTSSGTYIRTKGDANNTDDPWGRVRVLGSRVWVVKATVPKLGYLTVWARTSLIRFFLAIFIVVGVCALLIRKIWRPA